MNFQFSAKKFLFTAFEKEIWLQKLGIYIIIAVRKKKCSPFSIQCRTTYIVIRSSVVKETISNKEKVEGFHSYSHYFSFLVNNFNIWNILSDIFNKQRFCFEGQNLISDISASSADGKKNKQITFSNKM